MVLKNFYAYETYKLKVQLQNFTLLINRRGFSNSSKLIFLKTTPHSSLCCLILSQFLFIERHKQKLDYPANRLVIKLLNIIIVAKAPSTFFFSGLSWIQHYLLYKKSKERKAFLIPAQEEVALFP